MIQSAIERLMAADLVDEDGDSVDPELLPGLADEQIADAEDALGHPFPSELRAVLRRASGIGGLPVDVEFAGMDDGQALDDLFPNTATIAGDGFGNFWVVDLLQENGAWGPIWYLAHDPPVALYQCDGLATFIDELARMYTPPHKSLIDDVHEDRVFTVGRDEPGAMSVADARESGDPVRQAFAAELEDGWTIVDLRHPQPGMGVSWGHHGPRTEHRRHGSEPVFAYRAPAAKGRRLSRFLGGSS